MINACVAALGPEPAGVHPPADPLHPLLPPLQLQEHKNLASAFSNVYCKNTDIHIAQVLSFKAKPMFSTAGPFFSRTSQAVFRIRIRIQRIHMFLGLPDPNPDPLVRGMDPDPSVIKQK
jgi:hypothetical protein